MESVEKVTAEIVPHDQLHEGKWLLSVERPEWYYFMKHENNNVIRNNHFSESVDGPLKELVNFLHGLGIKTTPSCSGHHKSEKNFDTIYEALEKDKTAIRNGGLKLKDVESGEIYLFRDKQYDLPWNKNAFVDHVLKNQQDGVIGIRVNGEKKKKILQFQIPGVQIREKDSIVFIHTHEKETQEIKNIWEKITAEIKKVWSED
jgi:hypothetical protein